MTNTIVSDDEIPDNWLDMVARYRVNYRGAMTDIATVLRKSTSLTNRK